MTAFQYREFTLTCDHQGCRGYYGPFGVERSRAALRKLAAKDGWTHIHGDGLPPSGDEDYCPDHKPGP